MIGATELNNFFTNYEPPGGACVEKKKFQISKILLNKIFQIAIFKNVQKSQLGDTLRANFFLRWGSSLPNLKHVVEPKCSIHKRLRECTQHLL